MIAHKPLTNIVAITKPQLSTLKKKLFQYMCFLAVTNISGQLTCIQSVTSINNAQVYGNDISFRCHNITFIGHLHTLYYN